MDHLRSASPQEQGPINFALQKFSAFMNSEDHHCFKWFLQEVLHGFPFPTLPTRKLDFFIGIAGSETKLSSLILTSILGQYLCVY